MLKLFKSVFNYAIVGFSGTLVDWFIYGILAKVVGLHYLLSTVIAIVIATFANWLLGRLIAFRNAERKNIAIEILSIYAVGAVGIGLNTLLMYLIHGVFGLNDMFSKVLASFLVFFYNYSIRTFVIYKKQKNEKNT